MKAIYILTLFLLLTPFFLWGQYGDYCPCMDEENNLDDINNFVSQMNDELFTETTQTAIYSDAFALDDELISIGINEGDTFISLPKTVEQEQETEIEELQDTANASAPKDAWGYSKAYIKKSKKTFRVNIKSRTRAKKYKGRCPHF